VVWRQGAHLAGFQTIFKGFFRELWGTSPKKPDNGTRKLCPVLTSILYIQFFLTCDTYHCILLSFLFRRTGVDIQAYFSIDVLIEWMNDWLIVWLTEHRSRSYESHERERERNLKGPFFEHSHNILEVNIRHVYRADYKKNATGSNVRRLSHVNESSVSKRAMHGYITFRILLLQEIYCTHTRLSLFIAHVQMQSVISLYKTNEHSTWLYRP